MKILMPIAIVSENLLFSEICNCAFIVIIFINDFIFLIIAYKMKNYSIWKVS